MTVTTSYPNNITRQQYIETVLASFAQDYNEFSEDQLKPFILEIIAKVAEILDFQMTDDAKIREIQNLKLLLNNDQELIDSFAQSVVSQSSDSSISSLDSEHKRIATPTEVMESLLSGQREVIEAICQNKKITLGDGQNIQKLQAFIRNVTKKCIEDICNATLESQTQARPANNSPVPVEYRGPVVGSSQHTFQY